MAEWRSEPRESGCEVCSLLTDFLTVVHQGTGPNTQVGKLRLRETQDLLLLA